MSGSVLDWFRGSAPSMGPNSLSDPGALSVNELGAPLNINFGATGTMGMPAAAPASGLGAGFGMNIGTGQLALSGLGALANLWTGMQAQGLAKKQFGLSSQIANVNLNNSIRSYNTALEDRARARGVTEGRSQDYVTDYINANRLSR